MENKPRSAMAVASLVLGIVALVTSILPIINNLSFIMAILGVVFGIVGMVGISKGKKAGKGLAIAGLVLSVVAFVLVLVMQSAFSAAFDKAMEEGGMTPASAETAAGDASASGPQAAEQSESTEAAYGVSIDGCRVTEDYEGNPAVVVSYTFSNNSEETTSPAVALIEKVFQGGVQLDPAMVTDMEEGGKSMNDVKPGSSISYEAAYELADMSDIAVEVSELISFNDTILAEQTFSLS
ncbi:DUF5067 domain-containing protein [Adlercreutzia sp. R25]|uniref:DUF5067 domain-containing protein n=1 Tax=Adlercreutzia shanghongiae TaxID=3111773 RepID=A0ABU6IYX8_9ACTN|nr:MULTISPECIES: DUF5067 domain-containing protein [unclassified Adlercreutzia]MEC4272836.1 DUF5067 domain-containing protein [Adlercreutzia sp. R25]MEC4295050.1 DUF5067 domain-containing protein [Adlercreutzia sp. R22]